MRLILFATILLLLAHCTKKEEVPIPTCIQQKIDSIKQQPKSEPPVQVHLWEYNGRKVYLFSAGCCDQLVKVFDENCNYVCAPSGGLSGYGDSTCTDFYTEAQHRSMLWKDDR